MDIEETIRDLVRQVEALERRLTALENHPTPEEVRQSIEKGFREHVKPTWEQWDKQVPHIDGR
jgi:hypothetical protein